MGSHEVIRAKSAHRRKTAAKIAAFLAIVMIVMIIGPGISGVVYASGIGLTDGTYEIEVTMSGGSGKAHVESPAVMNVRDGLATARIVFSSPNYDYMRVEEQTYYPVNTEGNSAFEIPVTVFDGEMQVIADTTAMSAPHEITYTLYFDSASVREQAESRNDTVKNFVAAGLAAVAIGVVIAVMVLRKKNNENSKTDI